MARLKNTHLHQMNGEKRLRYDTRNTRTGLKSVGPNLKICGSNQYVPSEMFTAIYLSHGFKIIRIV